MANCSLSTNGNALNKFHITDIICDRLGTNGAPTRQMFKVGISSKWWCMILTFLADSHVGHLHLWHCRELLFIPKNELEKGQIVSISSVSDLLAGVFDAWKQASNRHWRWREATSSLVHYGKRQSIQFGFCTIRCVLLRLCSLVLRCHTMFPSLCQDNMMMMKTGARGAGGEVT